MSMSPEPEEESTASVLHRRRARVAERRARRERPCARTEPSRRNPRAARSAKNLFDRDAMAHNLNAVDGCRSYLTLFGAVGAGVVGATGCVEINQCVGCTRQFFTKSFLGDDAAVLARSNGEERAPPRYRAGIASMAWRTTR